MDNFQTKIRENIYQHFFVIYKKCLKLTLKSDKILVVKFDNILALKLLNDEFIKSLNKSISMTLNKNNNVNLSKIIKYHFENIKLENIQGDYLLKTDNKKIENLINPIKWNILNKFYSYLELDKLENNIFNILNFNEFIYYHIKYRNTYLQPLGYILILTFIIYLIDN
tara:strand:+ start:1065 stop:1568 length:504 start_codon:yes stop_codon:yes gene_type:complete